MQTSPPGDRCCRACLQRRVHGSDRRVDDGPLVVRKCHDGDGTSASEYTPGFAECDDRHAMGDVIDLLDRPVYGLPQIDRILSIPPGTAKRWIDGYTRSGKSYAPVIREQSTA